MERFRYTRATHIPESENTRMNAIGTSSIGPTFGQELKAANLAGLPFSWMDDGTFTYSPAMTTAHITAVQSVYASHNPNKGLPDAAGFEKDLKTLFASRSAIDSLAKNYPLFIIYLRDMNWAYVQDAIASAYTGGIINASQYASVKTFVTNRSIPITLP